jgi:hypothetical protein
VQHAVDMEKKQEVKMNKVIARGQQVFLELDGKVTLFTLNTAVMKGLDGYPAV